MGQVFVVSLHSIWELLWDKAETFWGPRIKQGFLCWELWGHCQVLLLPSVKLGFSSHLRSSFYPLLAGLVGFDLYLDQLCELWWFTVIGTRLFLWTLEQSGWVSAWNSLNWLLLKSDYRNRIIFVSFDDYGLKLYWITMPICSSNLCNRIWCRLWSWTVPIASCCCLFG